MPNDFGLAFIADSSEKSDVMKNPARLVLLVSALLTLFAFTATAVPLTLSLSNPNQMTAAPSSGVTTLSFSGTVTIDPDYSPYSANFDFPYNSSSTNSLTGLFNSNFLTFFGPGTSNGTYTGVIFTIDVPSGTPADLYAYQFMSSNLSMLTLGVARNSGGCIVEGCFVNGGPPSTFFASQAFSVNVTNGSQVPEGGSSVLLLAASVAGLLFVRRIRQDP